MFKFQVSRKPLAVAVVAAGAFLSLHAGGAADATKGIDFRLTFALGMWWIFEAPVIAIDLAWKAWACLVRISANSNHCSDSLVQILIEVIRRMTGSADAEFFDHLKRQWMDSAFWIRTRTVHFKEVTCCVSQNRLSHMAATRVAGAENEDFWFHGCGLYSAFSSRLILEKRCNVMSVL